MVPAPTSGSVDAGHMATPSPRRLERAGTGEIFGPRNKVACISGRTIYGASFMRDRDDAAKRFFVALVRGPRDLQRGYREDHLEIFAKYTRLPLETLRTLTPEARPGMKPDRGDAAGHAAHLYGTRASSLQPAPAAERIADDSDSRWPTAVAEPGPYRPGSP